jgi:hypothetical protein
VGRLAADETCQRVPRVVGTFHSLSARGNGADRDRAFGSKHAKHGEQTALVIVGGCHEWCPPDVAGLISIGRIAEPAAFRTAKAALVRSEINRRSFSASAAYNCSSGSRIADTFLQVCLRPKLGVSATIQSAQSAASRERVVDIDGLKHRRSSWTNRPRVAYHTRSKISSYCANGNSVAMNFAIDRFRDFMSGCVRKAADLVERHVSKNSTEYGV